MVTLPHEHRKIAESFGVDPARYDRARLPYPAALITRIVSASPGLDVLDVGCGTGIEARQFREAGCRVLGVEPDARMASFARGTGVEVEVAKIEDWDPAGRLFDAVVAGTAWHWVDPAVGTAKAASILRPGGRIALFWHTFELPRPIARALASAYRRVVPDSPFSFDPSVQGCGSTSRDSPRQPRQSLRQTRSPRPSSGSSTGSTRIRGTPGWTSCRQRAA